MDTYQFGQRAALEKFAVTAKWTEDRLVGGMQDRLNRLGPGAAAQSLKEFATRQTARANEIPVKMRQAGMLERFLRMGADLTFMPIHALTGGKHLLTTPGGMVDDHEYQRYKRQNLGVQVSNALTRQPSKVPASLARQYARGASITNKPTSLLTGDRLRAVLGAR